MMPALLPPPQAFFRGCTSRSSAPLSSFVSGSSLKWCINSTRIGGASCTPISGRTADARGTRVSGRAEDEAWNILSEGIGATGVELAVTGLLASASMAWKWPRGVVVVRGTGSMALPCFDWMLLSSDGSMTGDVPFVGAACKRPEEREALRFRLGVRMFEFCRLVSPSGGTHPLAASIQQKGWVWLGDRENNRSFSTRAQVLTCFGVYRTKNNRWTRSHRLPGASG